MIFNDLEKILLLTQRQEASTKCEVGVISDPAWLLLLQIPGLVDEAAHSRVFPPGGKRLRRMLNLAK